LRACRNSACRNDEKHCCRGAQPAARETSKHGSSPESEIVRHPLVCEDGCRNIPITLIDLGPTRQ
jgi:hypothetical protein